MQKEIRIQFFTDLQKNNILSILMLNFYSFTSNFCEDHTCIGFVAGEGATGVPSVRSY